MKKFVVSSLLLIFLITSVFSGSASAGIFSKKPSKMPIVSCDWLSSNLKQKDLVIIDVRTSVEYSANHIPNSINIPFETPVSPWIILNGDLLLELPEKNDLFKLIGDSGIKTTSKVVIVASSGQPPYPEAGATRAADTLIYAGVHNVSILDGGYISWTSKGKKTTTKVPTISPKKFTSKLDTKMFVNIDYVKKNIGKTTIIDARDFDVYSGKVLEPWCDKAGHIPSAISIPTPEIWNTNGTYKSNRELSKLVDSKLGKIKKNEEIIVYCGVGGYASSMWYVLTQILDYSNVKFYDGSAQEWCKYYDMEK